MNSSYQKISPSTIKEKQNNKNTSKRILNQNEINAKNTYKERIKEIVNKTKSHVTNKSNGKKNYNVINFNQGITQLSFEKKISKKDIYKESNLSEFILLLCKSQYITNNKNIRIVCHSGLMKTFLHDIIPSLKNKTKKNISNKQNKLKDIYEQNLWSIFLKTNNNNYISITRHGYTFANFLKSKGESLSLLNPLMWSKKIVAKLEQINEKDTALSLYGILTSLKQGEDLFNYEKSKNKIENYSYTIFVSVLIRTWMTAICLYLPNFSPKDKNENFSLYVAPFIKESGSTLDNTPDSIGDQMKNIYEFIYFFIRTDEESISDVADNIFKTSNNDVIKDVIKENINKISKYFKDGKKLNIFIPESAELYSIYYENGELVNEITFMKEKNILANKCNKINELTIDNISIFEGKEKLSKDVFGKISRWCEPFSKKNTMFAKRSTTGKQCKNRIKKNPIEVSEKQPMAL